MLKGVETVVGARLERQAILRLKGALAEVPFLGALSVKTQRSTADASIRFSATARIRRSRPPQPRDRRLLCQVKNSGQPRVAREACLGLAEEVRANPRAYPVFIAPYISPAAACICDRYDIGYLDFAGNCRLTFDTVFIKREGYPNPAVQKRDLRSLFSPKAERILRALLTSGPRAWRTQALADAAQVSLGQVASVKKLLADREWIVSTASGFAVAGFGLGERAAKGAFQAAAAPLIAEWAQNYRAARNEVVEFYSLKPIPEIEAQLAAFAAAGKRQIAFTGFSAAARFAPAVRYQRVSAYVASDIDAAAKALALKRVSSGANVVLIRPYDNGVFFGTALKDGAPVVSAIQTYLDLMATKGRGEEAAQAILQEVIQPQWR